MSLLCIFLQPPITLSFLFPNIIIIPLFSNIIAICSSLSVKDDCHMYQATGKIRVLYLIIALLIVIYELIVFS